MAATPITDGVSLESLFRDFYEHVVALKGRIQAAPAQSSEPQTPEADRPDGMTPQEVHEELVSFLKTQEAGALRLPGIRPDNYLDAQYVMAATADEVFLNIPWDGRPYWTDNLLESSLFESHVAGERLFRKLDKLLENRNRAQTDLAAVYLIALGVGFRGQYGGEDDQGQLARYRSALLTFVLGDQARPSSKGDSLLFPQAHKHTFRDGEGKRLKVLRNWVVTAALALTVWIGSSYVVWDWLTVGIEPGASAVVEELRNE